MHVGQDRRAITCGRLESLDKGMSLNRGVDAGDVVDLTGMQDDVAMINPRLFVFAVQARM